MSSLTSLNLSSFDTLRVDTMTFMFYNSASLRKLTLGKYFDFGLLSNLEQVPQNICFTGYWQNVCSGTINKPQGSYIFTSTQLMDFYNGNAIADTWVWQPRITITTPEIDRANNRVSFDITNRSDTTPKYFYFITASFIGNVQQQNELIDFTVQPNSTRSEPFTLPYWFLDATDSRIFLWEAGTMRPLIEPVFNTNN